VWRVGQRESGRRLDDKLFISWHAAFKARYQSSCSYIVARIESTFYIHYDWVEIM
jgi:hypothetical protein